MMKNHYYIGFGILDHGVVTCLLETRPGQDHSHAVNSKKENINLWSTSDCRQCSLAKNSHFKNPTSEYCFSQLGGYPGLRGRASEKDDVLKPTMSAFAILSSRISALGIGRVGSGMLHMEFKNESISDLVTHHQPLSMKLLNRRRSTSR